MNKSKIKDPSTGDFVLIAKNSTDKYKTVNLIAYCDLQ